MGAPVDKRLTFDEVAEIYDRARPSYPDQLFDDMFAHVGRKLSPSEPSFLEIAPGTGKATRSLLERGARVVAVEIGPRLAAFLERKLSPEFPSRLRVINSSFEDATIEHQAFDAVVIATAFEWIDPTFRVLKPHDALRSGGVLAVISTNQISSPADRGFFERAIPIYQTYQREEVDTHLHDEQVVPEEYEEIRSSGLFVDVQLRRYRWDQTYTTGGYADLVRSYSVTVVMSPADREGLIAELSRVIDEEYGGSVTRPLVITLTLGRRAK
jgi:SAM-dependent methyltransferase